MKKKKQCTICVYALCTVWTRQVYRPNFFPRCCCCRWYFSLLFSRKFFCFAMLCSVQSTYCFIYVRLLYMSTFFCSKPLNNQHFFLFNFSKTYDAESPFISITLLLYNWLIQCPPQYVSIRRRRSKKWFLSFLSAKLKIADQYCVI